MLPRISRRRSKLHGFGVFAAETIAKNTRIIDYAGELVRNDESEEREERYLAQGCIWVFRIDRTWSRDAAVGGNIARFINHACRPNCWFQVVDKTIWIRASRNIEAGEELTYDYATIGERTIACRCRPGCPNWLCPAVHHLHAISRLGRTHPGHDRTTATGTSRTRRRNRGLDVRTPLAAGQRSRIRRLATTAPPAGWC